MLGWILNLRYKNYFAHANNLIINWQPVFDQIEPKNFALHNILVGVTLFVFCLFVCFEAVSLHSPGCPQTHRDI